MSILHRLSRFRAASRLGLPFSVLARCRGCLGPLDGASEAGLCSRCWLGLLRLEPGRCPSCALQHGEDRACPDPVAWTRGDALWDYHGGRPPLGVLLVPGIKAGELGWMDALLGRLAATPLPELAGGVHRVTCAPPSPLRRLAGSPDLAEAVARQVARRVGAPFCRLLSRDWLSRRQASLPESRRRRLPGRAIRTRPRVDVRDQVVLLVDDVWTTGTTLLRCAQALQRAGAAEVRVLAAFRAAVPI